MRIVEHRPGELLRLRADDDEALRRRRWGSVPLALAVPCALALALPNLSPDVDVPPSTPWIWTGLFVAAVLLEVRRAIRSRELIGITLDRGRGVIDLDLRSAGGRVVPVSRGLHEVSIEKVDLGYWGGYRRAISLECRIAPGVPSVPDRRFGPLTIGGLLFDVCFSVLLRGMVLIVSLRWLRWPRRRRSRTRSSRSNDGSWDADGEIESWDVSFDGGDAAAIDALAVAIGEITGRVPTIEDWPDWPDEEHRPRSSDRSSGDSRDASAREDADLDPSGHPPRSPGRPSPFAGLPSDARDLGAVPLPPASPGDDSAPAPTAHAWRTSSGWGFRRDATSLGCSGILVFFWGLLLRWSLGSDQDLGVAGMLCVGIFLIVLVRALGESVHFLFAQPSVDEHTQTIRGGLLGGGPVPFESVERIVEVTTAREGWDLVVVTERGSFRLLDLDESPEGEPGTLAAQVAHSIGVPAERLELPRKQPEE